MCMNKSYLDFTVENAIMVFIEVKCHCISKILLEIFIQKIPRVHHYTSSFLFHKKKGGFLMSLWYNFWGHLRTILHHKNLVRHYCFRAGLYKQGIMHDWSNILRSNLSIVSAISKAAKKAQTLVKKQRRDILLHGFITKDATVTILNTGSTSL